MRQWGGKMYVPLKITTDYSLLKSHIKIEELIPFLKEHQITTAAIVDENLYGVMEFYNSCIKNGIKPIIGLELIYNEKPLYLYAKNEQGYHQLLKIHTQKEQKEITVLDLKVSNNRLKVILPVKSWHLLDELSSVFDDIYLGYQTEVEKNNALIITGKVVYVRDIKALKYKDTIYLDYLKMIDNGLTQNEIEKKNYEKNYFTLEYDQEDEESSKKFAEDLNLEIKKEGNYIPKFDNNIADSYEYLVALSKKGLLKRCNGDIPKPYIKRLQYELETIKKMGFDDYFLIVYDYVRFAKKSGILVGPGRGSAAGSLVSYTLGITDVDPIKYNLLFERFLNPERITMPDIDIDFEYTRRGEVIDYVKKRYGEKSVAGIMTFGTLGSKLVLRDIGKCLEINPTLINKFVSYIDAKKTLKENIENPAIKFYIENNSEIKKWYQIAMNVEGIKKHISTHAAGVVIASVALDDVIPICFSGGEMLTGVTMNYLEELGLLKMDFLALRNLTIIKNILDLIEKDCGLRIDLNKISLNDPSVLELFTKADTIGIFQFESTGMTHFLEKLKPTTFEDLVAALALFRPGPMDNIDSFIRRKEGKEKIDYLHKDLEDILKETYGIIVYQEQIMQILSKIGGFSFAESDNIRRAMSKKKKEVIEDAEVKFIEGAIQNGYEKKLAEKIYDLILKFANYGFNKAHSVSYALIGYQMAYLKVKYPIYYIANLLNMSMNAVDKTKEYLQEAKKRNYLLVAPDINESEREYKIKDKTLILPFSVIKNLGNETAETIILERQKNGPYLDFFDFVARTYGTSVNKKKIENLIDSGAFYHFEKSYDTLKENIDSAINYATLVCDIDATLLHDMKEFLVMKPTLKRVDDKILDDRTREFETFGFYLSNHPASKFNDKSITKIEHIPSHFDQYIKCIVVIENIKKLETKKKEPMAFINASDETGNSDFVVFHNVFSLLNHLKVNELIMIEGRVTKRFDKYQVNVTNIIKQ
jgi:DNA polymerase-3 subunit alpha